MHPLDVPLVPSVSFIANNDVATSGYPGPSGNGLGGLYGIFYNYTGAIVTSGGGGFSQGGGSSLPPRVVEVFNPLSVPSYGKIDTYERQDEYVDGSFFNFNQWRDSAGRSPTPWTYGRPRPGVRDGVAICAGFWFPFL